MSALQNLKKIVSGMSQEEINVARNLLGSFDSRGKNFTSKSIKLLDVLTDEKNELSENEIEYHLYGKNSSVAFSRLQIRFREKMLESLFLDVNIKREGAYSNQQKYSFEVRKKLSYAEILIERGQPDFALFIIKSSIELCEQYEYYEELLLAGRIKIRALTMLEQFTEVEKTFATIARWEIASKAALLAYLDYRRILASPIIKNRNDETERIIQPLLKRLRLDYEETESVTVAFYWYKLEIEYLQLFDRYRQARKTIGRLTSLVKNSTALQDPIRLGKVKLQNAKNEMYLYNFNASLTLCEDIQQAFEKDSKNELECLYIQFFNHFYSNDLNAAQLAIRDLLDRKLPNNKLLTSKFQLAFSAVLFRQSLFEQALDLLIEMTPIDEKTMDWGFGTYLMLILARIENTINSPTKQSYRLLKHTLDRLDQAPKQRKRHYLIFEILKALYDSSLDFRATYQAMQPQFEALNSNEHSCRWFIRSSELIIFHNWFFAHVIRSKYIHKMPKYIEGGE